MGTEGIKGMGTKVREDMGTWGREGMGTEEGGHWYRGGRAWVQREGMDIGRKGMGTDGREAWVQREGGHGYRGGRAWAQREGGYGHRGRKGIGTERGKAWVQRWRQGMGTWGEGRPEVGTKNRESNHEGERIELQLSKVTYQCLPYCLLVCEGLSLDFPDPEDPSVPPCRPQSTTA